MTSDDELEKLAEAISGAAEWMVEEITGFVKWWEIYVRPNRGARTDLNAERRLGVKEAETLCNI